MAKQVTNSGSTYFTDDAQYTAFGNRIYRGDGSYCFIGTHEDAHEVAESLAAGTRSDREFEWQDDRDVDVSTNSTPANQEH